MPTPRPAWPSPENWPAGAGRWPPCPTPPRPTPPRPTPPRPTPPRPTPPRPTPPPDPRAGTGVLPPAPDTWRRPRPGQDQAPPGWPAASLDPGCGRRPGAAEREHASTDPARDGADGQQREGLDRRFGCEPRSRSRSGSRSVTLDLRAADAPPPNA